MKKLLQIFIFLFMLSTSLLATNPTIYSTLGDTIYNNVKNIESLKEISHYNEHKEKINDYIADLNITKNLGFDVESGKKADLNLDYLQMLRKQAKVNDYFNRTVNQDFIKAIKTKDDNLFISVVNSGILDTKKNKNKIMAYYKEHKKNISADGIIQKYLNEEKSKNLKRNKHTKSKAQREKLSKESRIERIRENDILKQEALERKLEKELQEKKKLIREAQEKELFN